MPDRSRQPDRLANNSGSDPGLGLNFCTMVYNKEAHPQRRDRVEQREQGWDGSLMEGGAVREEAYQNLKTGNFCETSPFNQVNRKFTLSTLCLERTMVTGYLFRLK